MNRQRLQQLHDLALAIAMDAEKLRRFDLSAWVGNLDTDQDLERGDDDAIPDEVDILSGGCVVLKEGACNTAACMIGWAGQHPPFMEQGFCLKFGSNNGSATPQPVDTVNGTFNWEAVQSFFDIDNDTADDIFNLDSYPGTTNVGPLDVAERIKALLAA